MVGVNDLVVVDTPDALLVASKSAAHKMKAVVDTLKSRGHESTNCPLRSQRPWGTYATLKEEAGYKVKRITVRPGESLSLQYHHHRAEHWVVVQGLALIQVGDKETAGRARTVPPHPAEGKAPAVEHRHRGTGPDRGAMR